MPSETFDALSKLRDSNVNLSSRSVSFLCLEHEQELMTFMQKNKNEEIQEKAVITCMEPLALNKDDEYSVRRLVVGTWCSSTFVDHIPQILQHYSRVSIASLKC